jgi:hypothetical protein
VEDAYLAAGGEPGDLLAPPAVRSVRDLESTLPRARRKAFSAAVADRPPGRPRLVADWEEGEPAAPAAPQSDFPDEY